MIPTMLCRHLRHHWPVCRYIKCVDEKEVTLRSYQWLGIWAFDHEDWSLSLWVKSNSLGLGLAIVTRGESAHSQECLQRHSAINVTLRFVRFRVRVIKNIAKLMSFFFLMFPNAFPFGFMASMTRLLTDLPWYWDKYWREDEYKRLNSQPTLSRFKALGKSQVMKRNIGSEEVLLSQAWLLWSANTKSMFA